MSNYKNVRLEGHVYQELIRRMKPRESMSQVIERALNNLDQASGHVQAVVEILGGAITWNTKR